MIRLLFFTVACVVVTFTRHLPALEAAPGTGISLQQLEEFRSNGVPDEHWPALLESLGREDRKNATRSLIMGLAPFPKAKLVELLTHEKLAVRLGALDLLEDSAGETFGFDPWQESPSDGANIEALEKWKSWVKTGKATVQSANSLTADGFRNLALEIMSGHREKSERAMRRLDSHGLSAIAHIEAFLNAQPSLEPAARSALKNAEYRVVILQSLPKQAAALSRDLAFGAPETQSTALGSLAEGGPGVLPIIAEFLGSPDPLVRESAVDSAFKAGQTHAVAIILDRISRETTESVLHAMLRGLGQYSEGTAGVAAMVQLLNHPSENVVVSAIEALAINGKGSFADAVSKRLSDPRWRVRAAALEAIGKGNIRFLHSQVAERLQDPDLFVRVTAVNTLQKVAPNDSARLLTEEFKKQDELKAPILDKFLSDEKNIPGELWDALWNTPPEVILQCLNTLEVRGDHEGKRIPNASRFTMHPNRDVAASALRLLASHGRNTAVLLDALKGDDEVLRDAVLDQLRLHPGFLGTRTQSSGSTGRSAGASGSNPLLDRLYSTFGKTPPQESRTTIKKAPSPTKELHASPEEMRSVLARYLREGSPRQRFQAANVLASQGDTEAATFLLQSFDTFSSLDKRAIALSLEGLASWSEGPFRELAVRLLRDSADDVREKAIETWLHGKSSEKFSGLLAELSRPGSLLRPDDVYGYETDRLLEDPRTQTIVLDWSRKTLADNSASNQNRVLAIVLLGRSGQAQEAGVDKLLDAPQPWIRRAAYRALGFPAVRSRLEAILKDDSAAVRAVLPFLASPDNSGWRHWFDDRHHVHDYEDLNLNRSGARPRFGSSAKQGGNASGKNPEVIAALEKLANDPSDQVRFEARFALLRLGQPIDPAALAALIAAQPTDNRARDRVGNFLEAHYTRLGTSYGVLVPLVAGISKENQPKLLSHFGLHKDKAFTSFAALVKLAPALDASPPSHEDTAVNIPIAAAPTEPSNNFRLIFFFKPGCKDCDRVRDMLQRHASAIPEMTIDERNIQSSPDALLNEALSARFQLKDIVRQVTPAVFTQAGVLIRDDITFPRLGDLLRKTAALAPDPNWARIETGEITAAQQTVTQRYEALSLGVVATAGLLDGVNPCAFATIIFLLSYLQVARRTPREILAVGAAFISAVFLSYFFVGLGLAQLLTQLSALRFAGTVLNYLLAGFALMVAMLSFRDAQLAAQGNLSGMTLQLPGMLKDQIRSVVRTGSRSSRFVMAAFAAGIVISLLELACTGQVYLPTIQYMLRSGRTGATGHLLLYNTAFIVPLIVVFLLAFTGLRSESLIRFQKKHTATVKVLTGILFLLLAAFLIFGAPHVSLTAES